MTFVQPEPGRRPRAARPLLERPGFVALLFLALASLPTACFTLTVITDIAYWRTSHRMWQNFSAWLLLAGLVDGVGAMILGIVTLILRRSGYGWSYIGVDLLVLLLAFMNSLVHARDGWTAVVPWGLTLSTPAVDP